MRKVYTYRVIKYFPHIRSDEFFNVGIWLWDEQGNKKQVYIDKNQEHIKHLLRFPSINKKALPFFLENIKQEINAQSWYDNHLRFSEIDSVVSEQDINEVANILYEDYIGYKFHVKEQKDRYAQANEITKMVYEKKFQNKLILTLDNDFSFYAINKKTERKYYGKFGSVNDKSDIQELMYFSLKDKNHTKMNITLLGIVSANEEEIKSCEEYFLNPNYITYAPYLSSEDSERYFDSISQVA
ncbi:MAG: DUF3037 domain-containing protein [Helicobacter sp.]|nr:DUF3037 domain-containing protein [Helicobacter sp.]